MSITQNPGAFLGPYRRKTTLKDNIIKSNNRVFSSNSPSCIIRNTAFYKTRNLLSRKVPRVRIPISPPNELSKMNACANCISVHFYSGYAENLILGWAL